MATADLADKLFTPPYSVLPQGEGEVPEKRACRVRLRISSICFSGEFQIFFPGLPPLPGTIPSTAGQAAVRVVRGGLDDSSKPWYSISMMRAESTVVIKDFFEPCYLAWNLLSLSLSLSLSYTHLILSSVS
jgi:hypothetical protein